MAGENAVGSQGLENQKLLSAGSIFFATSCGFRYNVLLGILFARCSFMGRPQFLQTLTQLHRSVLCKRCQPSAMIMNEAIEV